MLIEKESVVRLWLARQHLAQPRGTVQLHKCALSGFLAQVGALQLDSIFVLERAHYLTLWSRFGSFDRRKLDHWIYRDQLAYEYWGHEASILPVSHLPLGLRRMRRFPPPSYRRAAWWQVYATSPAAKRRVLRRLQEEGPLESTDFETQRREGGRGPAPGGTLPLPAEDKRSLQLLWHAGKVAVRERRHFRRVYDLAERVYPPATPASATDYDDSWLFIGLSGNGIASVTHLTNYVTGPKLDRTQRHRVIARNLNRKRIVEVRVKGFREPFYVLPEHLEQLSQLPEPAGTTLISPFDSLLWQRKRAEQLMDFRYRVEIYTPAAKREFGYYVLPILHNGRLVGRLDPKLDRQQKVLQIKSLFLEPGVKRTRALERGLSGAIDDLCEFLGAQKLALPKGWSRLA